MVSWGERPTVYSRRLLPLKGMDYRWEDELIIMADTSTRRRVKLYMLNEDRMWDDRGTGHVSSAYVERLKGMSLQVRSETDGEYSPCGIKPLVISSPLITSYLNFVEITRCVASVDRPDGEDGWCKQIESLRVCIPWFDTGFNTHDLMVVIGLLYIQLPGKNLLSNGLHG